jgi:hypothetical protein
MLYTSCRNCVFAEYLGDTMTDEGCTLGRIARFEAAGATVTGVDDGVKKYLVVDRFCSACHDPASPFLKGKGPGEWADAIRSFIRPRIAYVVHADLHATAEGLSATLGSVRGQGVRPAVVVLVDDGSPIGRPAMMRALRTSGLSCPWRRVVVEACPEEDERTYGGDRGLRALDEGVAMLDPKDHVYYAVARAGVAFPAGLSGSLDRAINEELRAVSAVLPDASGVYAVQTLLHNHAQVGGNKGVAILEKLGEVAADHPGRVVLVPMEGLLRG